MLFYNVYYVKRYKSWVFQFWTLQGREVIQYKKYVNPVRKYLLHLSSNDAYVGINFRNSVASKISWIAEILLSTTVKNSAVRITPAGLAESQS